MKSFQKSRKTSVETFTPIFGSLKILTNIILEHSSKFLFKEKKENTKKNSKKIRKSKRIPKMLFLGFSGNLGKTFLKFFSIFGFFSNFFRAFFFLKRNFEECSRIIFVKTFKLPTIGGNISRDVFLDFCEDFMKKELKTKRLQHLTFSKKKSQKNGGKNIKETLHIFRGQQFKPCFYG